MNQIRKITPGKIYSPDWQASVDELTAYERAGCKLLLSGRPSHPREIAAACVREENGLMRDYIADEDQKIRYIDFTRINRKK